MRPLFRIVPRAVAVAALCLVALPALASTQPRRTPAAPVQQDAAAMCRAGCLSAAAGAPGGVTQRAAQVCAIRCGAEQGYLAQQHRRGTAEATGRGRAAGPLPPAPSAAAPALGHAMPVAAGLATAGAARAAIYGGRAPSASFGMAVGIGDRLAAHRHAEAQCSQRGQGCRVLAEFTSQCGAVAQGVQRSQWALVMTSDPNTYVVTSISAGSGASQAAAEADAMAECRSKDRGAQCRVVAATCRSNG
jgi:hypothetical protein